MAAARVYVVWKGRQTGIFDTWEQCRQQVDGFPGARYKSFSDRKTARQAFLAGPSNLVAQKSSPADGLAVDAACSGNPGRLEWRGVRLADGRMVFHGGPFPRGTNNIGEFLAIVQALQVQARTRQHSPVYSDSKIAIGWVRRRRCRTRLAARPQDKALFDLLAEAEIWLAMHPDHNPVLHWDTAAWGEIPADFNRK